jgi:hypothetical protein
VITGPSTIWPVVWCCALTAAGLGLCVYLFITVKAELRTLARRRLEEQIHVRALEGSLEEARLSIERVQKELLDVESQTGMLVPPAPAKSSLSLSRRTQVLRMHRAGNDCASIAVSLGLPRNEVELLTKVQRIVMEKI